MKIELLDYVLDMDDNFWIVNNITDTPKGYVVYRVAFDGERYNPLTNKNYIKDNDDNGIINIPNQYKRIFKPREFYNDNKNNLEGIWKEYAKALNQIGILDENIGIFGSYLIGFSVKKDIDFVIYGLENLKLYFENKDYIKSILKAKYISLEHINYQYLKHRHKFSEECDLKEIISRNWSGIQLSNDILSTPRFVDNNLMLTPIKYGIDKIVQVKVIDSLTSSLLPRRARVIYNNVEYLLISSLWKFESFARNNDVLEIFGNVDEKRKIIILDSNNYYIKFISKGDQILD